MTRQMLSRKKLVIGCGVLVLVLFFFLLEENLRGKIALRAYLRQLREQGEKLTLAEVGLPQSATGNHGVTELLALTNQFNALRKDCPFPADSAARFRLAAPGRALVRGQQPDLGVARKSYARWSERATWTDLAEQIARAADVLEKLKTAVAQPMPGIELDYTQGMEMKLPHLTVVGAGANWLALAALHDLRRHDCAAATSNIIAIAALTRLGSDDRFTYSHFTRAQAAEVGLNMTWQALQTPGWTDEQLLALQQAWQVHGPIQSTVAALEMERVIHRRYFAQARRLPGWNQLRQSLLDQTHSTAGS